MDNSTHIYIQSINSYDVHKCKTSVCNSSDALAVRFKELTEWLEENKNKRVNLTQEYISLKIERKLIKTALEKALEILDEK